VPPPLDTPLEIRDSDGGVSLFDGDVVVAQAKPASVAIDVPESPGFEAAEEASRRFRGFDAHWYPSCFVCGPDRGAGDGLRIFPGPFDGGARVVSPWVPDASLTAGRSAVPPEILWAALDCPGAFSFETPPEASLLLGELRVTLRGEVSVGERCVLAAWQLSREGRKHHTATVLFGESGDCRGIGIGTWIEVRR
jgi:hypothetical protein